MKIKSLEAAKIMKIKWLVLGAVRIPDKSSKKFSVVSKPNFASKRSSESAGRDLQNALLCTNLQSQFINIY